MTSIRTPAEHPDALDAFAEVGVSRYVALVIPVASYGLYGEFEGFFLLIVDFFGG